jgi:hypothetical protein
MSIGRRKPCPGASMYSTPSYFHTDYPLTKTGPPRSVAGHCPALDKSTTPYWATEEHNSIHSRPPHQMEVSCCLYIPVTLPPPPPPRPCSTMQGPQVSTERHRTFLASVMRRNVCFGDFGVSKRWLWKSLCSGTWRRITDDNAYQRVPLKRWYTCSILDHVTS